MTGAMQARRRQLAPLLEFLMPGLLHSLGNHLFAIQGNAQVLGMREGEIDRERQAILEAAGQARAALDIIRCLSGEQPELGTEQAGAILRRVCEISRIPLLEAGLRCQLAHSSIETPINIDSAIFTQCLLETLRCIREELPSGFDGELHIDLRGQSRNLLAIGMRVQQNPDLLPFPLNLGQVASRAEEFLSPLQAHLVGPSESGELVLHVAPQALHSA